MSLVIPSTLKASVGRVLRALAESHGYRIEGGSQGWAALLFNPLLKVVGIQLVPQSQFGEPYIDFGMTVAHAKKAGMSVPAYVAEFWGERGVVDNFVRFLSNTIPLASCARILEIGAGTGRFLEAILNIARVLRYEVYETNAEWSSYLAKTYPIVAHQADGKSLSATPDATQHLIHAHNVFVYLLPVRSFIYFEEIARVCAPGGFVVFDAFTDDLVDLSRMRVWIDKGLAWPIVLSRMRIREFFREKGFELVTDNYTMPTYGGLSRYFIFRKPV